MEEGKDKIKKLLVDSGVLPPAAQKDVVEHYGEYKRLIGKMARKYVRDRVEYEDLIQEAAIGLILACRQYDPSRSDNFHRYAIYRMKGKMYEYCIGNENPIYVPTHIAKAASYIKQMRRLLGNQPYIDEKSNIIIEIASVKEHAEEKKLKKPVQYDLSELKRKLGNIANNSRMTYEKLAGLAMESLSMIVSDDILSKFPEEGAVIEDIVSNSQLAHQLKESLGERKFTVLYMRTMGWNLREISEHLEKLGYTNRQGKRITRQAVKAILVDTLQTTKKLLMAKGIKLDSRGIE